MRQMLMLGGCLLAACATEPGPVKVAAPALETRPDAPSCDTPGVPPVVVPGPDGRARVLVTARGTSLQQRPEGPLELLDTPADDVEEARWTEKAKELAEGVRWSPHGTRVCLLQLYKRGSGLAVFTLTSRPATEVELDLDVLQKAIEERYGDKFRTGRFYYIAMRRWIDEDHLEIEFSGNLAPKDEGLSEDWERYYGTVSVELGAKSGTVQGALKWKPLTKWGA